MQLHSCSHVCSVRPSLPFSKLQLERIDWTGRTHPLTREETERRYPHVNPRCVALIRHHRTPAPRTVVTAPESLLATTLAIHIAPRILATQPYRSIRAYRRITGLRVCLAVDIHACLVYEWLECSTVEFPVPPPSPHTPTYALVVTHTHARARTHSSTSYAHTLSRICVCRVAVDS